MVEKDLVLSTTELNPSNNLYRVQSFYNEIDILVNYNNSYFTLDFS